jgi:hypothetical protein
MPWSKRMLPVLIAVVAMGALFATAGQAEAAEYFTCVKASPKNTGNYTDKECSVKAGTPGTGKYERASAVGITYASKTKTAVLSTPAIGGKVTCKKSTGTSKITSATTDEDEVTFVDCTSEGKPCQNAGGSSGVIKTNTLLTTVVSATETEFTSLTGRSGYQAEFECGGVPIRTKGFTIGHTTSPAAEHANKKSTVTFSGEENLETEVNIGAGFIGPFPSEENTTASNKYSEAVGVGGSGGGGGVTYKITAKPIPGGGLGVKVAGKTCKFEFIGATCEIEVKNESTVKVTISKTGVANEAHFRVVPPSGCQGAKLPVGGVCIDEAEFTGPEEAKAAGEFTTNYFARVIVGGEVKAEDTADLEAH